jgi:predicted TIM-barrel fold metal-dependent hydrolase
MNKIWVNSGDSHVQEPDDLWTRELPAQLKSRGPRSEVQGDKEIYYIDNEFVKLDLVAIAETLRPPGASDVKLRVADLDAQGIWSELLFASKALWVCLSSDRELVRECLRVYNDWLHDEYLRASPRFVGAAMVSPVSTEDAVEELQRAASMGYHSICLPTTPPEDRPFHSEVWEPLWAAAAEARLPLCFHVGTGIRNRVYRGAGAALINFVESCVPGTRTTSMLVAAGVLERHPTLKIAVMEAGASWMAVLADRMDESYRQHGMWMKDKLEMPPSEYMHRQVYASFQHDRTALATVRNLGFRNVMWGSDYPHAEGTFPKTQEVLHELFEDADAGLVDRVTVGAFEELFPTAPRIDRGSLAASAA